MPLGPKGPLASDESRLASGNVNELSRKGSKMRIPAKLVSFLIVAMPASWVQGADTNRRDQPGEPLLVGAAQVDITPDLPVEKGGPFRSLKATGILSPLTAQAVAWQKGSESVIWVSCDLGNIIEEPLARFRQRVAEQTGVPPERIHVSATHTHGSPTCPSFSIIRNESQEREVRETYDTIMEKAAAAAVEAHRNRKPARLGYGRGRAERTCFNRRFIMPDGTARMYGGPNQVRVEGPVDHEVQVVWFEHSGSGSPIAVLVNLAVHPSQMYGSQRLGSEYPGVMRETVCAALGRTVPILFLQGACGNVCTRDCEKDLSWGRGTEGIRTIGKLLAGEVIRLLHGSRATATEGVVFAQTRTLLDLPYRSFPEHQAAPIRQIIRAAYESPDPVALLEKHFPSTEQKARANMIAQLDFLKEQRPTETLELVGIRLGDIVFVTTPAHQFVEFQIDLKKAFLGKPVVLVDLTNGFVNYVPTRQAIERGGYTTERRRFGPEAGEMILAASVALVDKLLILDGPR